MAFSALPAHQAAQIGDLDELQRLYASGRRPPADEETGETPLHASARACQLRSLKWLLEHTSVDPQTRAKNGETAAHLTAFEGWLDGLRALCDYDERRRVLMVTDQDLQGLTPLHVAIIRGHAEYVEWILENFSSEKLNLNERGSLAVHFAAASGNLAILRLLVEAAGPDCVNQADDNDATPVYFAAQDGKLEAIKYLVTECGANAKAKSADGMQPLHAATQNGHIEVVKWLVARLGKTTLLDAAGDGATAVHFAAAAGHADILKWFFVTSAQNNAALARAKDNMQSTPAHDAVDYGHLECVKILLKNGADLFATDKESTSPYSLAMEHTDLAIKEYVMEYIRLNHLTPPDPAHPTVPTSQSIYENVNHPVIPKSGGIKSMSESSDSGIRTLHTMSQEIEAAQQEVMKHKLTSALEAAAISGGQSFRQRPQRRPSFKELKPPVDHSPRKGAAPPPPPAPAPATAFMIDGVLENGAAEIDSPAAGRKLPSRSRDEPDGEEHGTLHREVDSWFSGSPSKKEKESDEDTMGSGLEPRPTVPKRSAYSQRRSGSSWYSSDDTNETNLPAMAAEQLLSGKPQQRRRQRRRNMGVRSVPRYQYMPVYQPVLTPYGYMLAQTMMPVPVYGGPPRRGSTARTPNRQVGSKRSGTPVTGPGGRRVLRKDSGRLPTNTPNLNKGFSKSINSLGSLDEEGEEPTRLTRRRSSVGEEQMTAAGNRRRSLSPRSRSYTSMGLYSPPISPYGFSPYASMYGQPMSPPGSAKKQERRSSFMKRLFHNENSSLPRTRSMSSVPTNQRYQQDDQRGFHSDLDGTLSTSALGERYERGSTIVALAVSTAVTAMSVVSTVPQKNLMPTLADGAQRAITHFGLGEPIDLDEMRDPARRQLITAKATEENNDEPVRALQHQRKSSSDLQTNKPPLVRRFSQSKQRNRSSGSDIGADENRKSSAWEFDFKMETQASQRWGHDDDRDGGLAMGEGIASHAGVAARHDALAAAEKEEQERRKREADERKREREEERRREAEDRKREAEDRKREAEERKRRREEEERLRQEEERQRRDEAQQQQRQEEAQRRREEEQRRKEEEQRRKEEERQRKEAEEEERRERRREQEEQRRREEEERRREREEAERKREEEREQRRKEEEERKRRKREEEEQKREEERERKRREEEEKRQLREEQERKRQEEKEAKKREEEEKRRKREEERERKKAEEEQKREEEREKKRQEEEEKKRKKEEEKRRKEAEKERKKQEEEDKKRQKEEMKERKKREQEEKRREEEEEKKRKKELRHSSVSGKKETSEPDVAKFSSIGETAESKPKNSKPLDDDDPFGLSELALALELAGEAEYWKEHLTFEDGDEDPHAKPTYESKASVDASAAAAVIFDESGLEDVLRRPSSLANHQPSQGSLGRPSTQTEPGQSSPTTREAVLAMAAALTDFGDDDLLGSPKPAPPPPPPAAAPSMVGVGEMGRERTRSTRGQATSAIKQMSVSRDVPPPTAAGRQSPSVSQLAGSNRTDLSPGGSRPGSAGSKSNNSAAGDELQRIFDQRKKKTHIHYMNNTS